MKVLMFGWEFPPFASGGLGTACYGLTKGLKNNNIDVIFVMPRLPENISSEHVELISAHNTTDNIYSDINLNENVSEVIKINSILRPYMTANEYEEKFSKTIKDVSINKNNQLNQKNNKIIKNETNSVYGQNLFEEVWRYRQTGIDLAKKKQFDIIHCHDWMTYGAGIEAKKATGKPLVLHIHATEFDRTGDNPNQYVYELEKEGFMNADKILAVSNFTKNKVIKHYNISPDKIEVVHNAVEWSKEDLLEEPSQIPLNKKIILFLGRITIQKGPDWFLYTAKKVAEYDKDAMFIVAGSGDMEHFMIKKAAELGLSNKILFAGFLKGKDIDKAYRMAKLYVMPSISEPFGITPLESMRNGTPVLISKQSGVSEVVRHCLKADFWDINDMSNKIISTLKYTPLHQQLKDEGLKEVRKFSWNKPAKICKDIYHNILNNGGKIKW
jgi:glycogen synthase